MPNWQAVVEAAPVFAERVRAAFDAGTNKTMATLRRDGGPRISAIEMRFRDGEVTFGSMPGAVKLRDLQRDPRLAVHSPTRELPAEHHPAFPPDAKIAGRAVGMPAPAATEMVGSSFFRIEISEVVLTYVGEPADHLVIESWHPVLGWRRRTRT